ncbi:MAG TPA: hypothetical protein DD613_04060, partial [Firmicutes bacterium]|nr:hypothetical protein [Bacillota bacterium]
SIDIQEDGSNKSTINDTSVTVPASTKVYLNITLTSVNEIDSKYTLAYKTSTNAKVEYSDRTPWNTQGVIKGIDINTYSKKIRVVIDNTDVSTSSIVNFQVYGGYSFNSYANIELTDGYITVSGPYTEVTTNIGNRLVDIIESDTSCLTSNSNTCLYGGENIKNYVQYPENEDKTKNLWRIIGSYQIDDQTLPKLISQSTTSTSTSTLTTDLTSFYNTLEDKDVLVQQTNKFNCFTSTCAESTYSNIGLLTDYEYNQIGGVNSYLATTEKYYINSSSGIKEVTSSGITNPSNTSGLKPTIYLQTGVQVTGSGTASDPYIISPASDINLVAYTLNGEATNKTYAELLKTNVVKNVTCKNGTTATWDNTDFSIKLKNIHTPDYCTIDFGDGYSVSLTATNGTVSPSNITVGYNGTATFTVKPNSGYKLELETNNCGGTLSGNTYTISNITSAKSCSITFKKNISLLATLIQTNAVNENGYRYEGTDPNNYIQMEKIDGTTEMWRIIGLFPDGANGEDIIRVRKVGYEKAAYDSTNKTNHWPKTTLYTTLSSTYSLTNYKNTVNYKMYLGGASSVPGYTSQDLYDMERMLNSKGTAGKTSQDSYSSTTTFTGSVGLMYPSDYGYAVLASDCARNIQPYNYDRTSSCYINNWLFQGSSTWQWAISPNSFYANSAFHVLSSGLVFYNYGGGNFNHMISFSGSYSPVMALKSDVYVTGSGTQSDPYVMQ